MPSAHKMAKHTLKILEHLPLQDFQGMFDHFMDFIGLRKVVKFQRSPL